MSTCKKLVMACMTLLISQSALAKSWDLFDFKVVLQKDAQQYRQGLFCNSEAGKFTLNLDNYNKVVLSGLVYGNFGTSHISLLQCEESLDQVLCSYGFEKWIAVDFREVNKGENGESLLEGIVKSSALSSDLEHVTCSITVK